jgi:hypothetical protein
MSRFVMKDDVETTAFDWGSAGMRAAPTNTAWQTPGASATSITTYVPQPYNDFDEPAQLQVVLAPSHGDGGYTAVDVSTDEPWASRR